ncbi:MAG TPA: Na-translocating system protein MpsC family protein [Solirubrobacteraceae bacterium]|nr:Na-translocating system protein MpsC family protein [Solirubrobacteraceae bacterium]
MHNRGPSHPPPDHAVPDRARHHARSSALREGGLAGEVASAFVRLHHEHFGRGPAEAHAYVGDAILVCVLSDIYTQSERTMLDLGKREIVREARLAYQRAVEAQHSEIVERVTGRRVVSFAGTVTFEPDQAVELFTLGERLAPDGERDVSAA